MAINLTDSLNAATSDGKLADAKQIYLDGNKENVQEAVDAIKKEHSSINNKQSQIEQSLKDIAVTGGASTAAAVSFDNNKSELNAVTAQEAIDELAEKTEKTKVLDNIDKEPTAGSENLVKSGGIANQYGCYEDNPEFVKVYLDNGGHILWGIQKDGNIVYGAGVPQQVKNYIGKEINKVWGMENFTEKIDSLQEVIDFLESYKNNDTLQALLKAQDARVDSLSETKVDKVESKSLIDAEYAEGVSYIESPEFVKVELDADGRIICGVREDGSMYFATGIDIAGQEVSSVIDNPEFIKVWLDSAGHILFGIKRDGDIVFGVGVPSAIKAYIDKKLKEVEGTALDADAIKAILEEVLVDYVKQESLDEQLEKKVDGEYIDNPEFVQVSTDVDGNVLEARRSDGIKEEKVGFETPMLNVDGVESKTIEDPEQRVEIKTDADGNIISYRNKDGGLVEPVSVNTPEVIADKMKLSNGGIKELIDDLYKGGLEGSKPVESPSKDTDDINPDEIEIAVGKTASYGSYRSELDAIPIVNDAVNHYVGFDVVRKSCATKQLGDKIVIINHDDLSPSDYTVTRKIYNKYESNGSFCAILTPFTSIQQAKEKIISVKKMINNGHEIGLHSIMGYSYWRENALYDVRPDGGNTFAPNKQELLGDSNGIGSNIFGKDITEDTTVADLFYGLSDSFYGNRFTSIKAVDITDDIVNEATRQFVTYSDEQTIYGIDDTEVDVLTADRASGINLTSLQWLEKYYNAYVDDSLGFSKYDGTIAERFAEDYSVPTGAKAIDYYPDADHLLNGKMVYWNNTDNPHYSEAKVKTDGGFSADDYQLVGKFKKGLYKDSFSTCNYEVMDRCAEIATAFYRKHYGLHHFTDAHTHGIKYLTYNWEDNQLIYLDRTKKVLRCNGLFYVSRIGCFMTEGDMFNGVGFKPISVGIRIGAAKYEGLAGFYFGQDKIKNTAINSVGSSNIGECSDYLNLFGKTVEFKNGEVISYNDFIKFTEGIDNFSRFFFENSGNTVERNGATFTVQRYFHNALLNIVSAIDTGKVPVLTLDTIIQDNTSQDMSVDLLLRFCKYIGYDVVPYYEGWKHINTNKRNVDGNLFPNYEFKQSLLDYFGGKCEISDGYIPDGWVKLGGNIDFSVENKIFTVNGSGNLCTRIFGLPAGEYKLEYTINTTGNTSTEEEPRNRVFVKTVKNKDVKGEASVIKTTHAVNGTDTKESITITIPQPERTYNSNDGISQMLDGYQDNVFAIEIYIRVVSNISIKNCSLYKL